MALAARPSLPRRSFVAIAVGAMISAAGLADLTPIAAAVQKDSAKPGNSKAKSKSRKKASAEPPSKAEPATEPAPRTDLVFSRDVAPLISANCSGCHDAKHRSGFDQTTFESLLKGGKSGPAIVSGNPEESLIVKRIKGEEGRLMPPGGNRRLSDASISKIETWIKQGAKLDAGRDPTQALSKYAATPEEIRRDELAKLSVSDRDKKTEAAARERWKKAGANEPKTHVGAGFLLFANLPEERATALLKSMDAQRARLSRLFAISKASGLKTPEKISLYIFNDEKTYVEFSRSVENRETEPGDVARVNFRVESPYIVAIDPLSGGEDPLAAGSSKRASRKHREESAAERTLVGILAEQLAVGHLSSSGTPPKWLSLGLGATFAAAVDPRSTYVARLRLDAANQFRLGWKSKAGEALGDAAKDETLRSVGFAIVEWLSAPPQSTSFPAFLNGMLGGAAKIDEVPKRLYNLDRSQFLDASGLWVSRRYGRLR